MSEACSRRLFLGGLLGSVALVGCQSFRGVAEAKPRLRLGLLADIHVSDEDGDFSKFGDTKTFEHALAWFRDQQVDGVIIAGDLADNGMRSQLKKVGAAWSRIFPEDRAPDGRPVAKLFVYGNHDAEGQNYDGYAKRFFDPESFKRDWVATDPAAAWEEAFHEPYEPIWLKTVNGYQFVGAHWVAGQWNGIAAVEKWFKDNAARIDRTKPFFYIQHPTPKNTSFGPNCWGHDAGFSTRALSAFPNAVAFSGHCHCSETDDRFIWQDAFTAISLGSLRYGGYGSTQTLLPGKAKLLMDETLRRRWQTRQGALLTVYDHEMVLACRDFVRDEPVREEIVIPLPAATEKPFRFAPRAERAKVPAWPAAAKIALSRQDGKVTLTFPSLDAPVRIVAYELSVVRADGVREVKYVAQPNFDLASRHRPSDVRLTIDGKEIPEGARVALKAMNCFGTLGPALEG